MNKATCIGPYSTAGRMVLAFVLVGWLADRSQAEIDSDRWRWSNPLPHGNNVMDMLLAQDVAAQVGDGGSIHVQRDGGRWAPAVTGVTNYLRGIALMGQRFVAVGEAGCILWSDDGKSFQPATLSPTTSDWFEGVAASAQRAVAVGDNGSIYTSTNGIDWTRATSGTLEWLRGVAFGNNSFVAVGENGTILRNASGASWNRIGNVTSEHLNRVRYVGSSSGSQFIAVGENGAAFGSTSGSSGWTSFASGTTNSLNDVALNDTGLLLVGDQEIRLRAAGATTWVNQIDDLPTNAPPPWTYLSAASTTNRFLVAGRTGLLIEGGFAEEAGPYEWHELPDYSSHAWLWDLVALNGTYVAVGDLASILTSLDGILWARETVPVSPTNTVLLGVGGTTNLLLAVGNAGTVLISPAGETNLTVTNIVGTNIVVTNATIDTWGVVWTNLPVFTAQTLQGVTATADLYLLCGAQGSIFTSADGTNWQAQSTPVTNFLSAAAAFPAGWVVAGNNGTLLHSDAGATNWTAVSLDTTNWIYRVRWVGDQLIAVGQNGTLLTSDNGTQWTVRNSGTSRWINDVTFVGDTWYAVGNQGLCLASTNLADWSPVRLPTIKSLFGASAWNGQLVVAGIEGVILRNPVVPPRSPVNILGYHYSVATETIGTGTNQVEVPTSYELFLFGGQPDQQFDLEATTTINLNPWPTNAPLELFDPSGTIYVLRTRDYVAPACLPEEVRCVGRTYEFYRTRLTP